MNDFDDEHIDKISQTAFDNQEIDEFIPNWGEVEIQLNKLKTIKKRSIFTWFFLPIFFSIISIKLNDTQNKSGVIQTKVTNTILNNKNDKKTKVTSPEVVDIPSNNKEGFSNSLVRQPKRSTLKTDQIFRSNKNERVPQKSNKNQSNLIILEKAEIVKNRNTDQLNSLLPQKINNDSVDIANNHISETSNGISHVVDHTIKTSNDSNLVIAKISNQLEVIDTPKQVIKTSAEEMTKQSKTSLLISYGKDYNFPNINAINYLATSIGLGINYRLTKNISLRTGINYIHSPVYQNGDGFSFKVPSNIPSYTTLKLIDAVGYLNYIEIPLAIRYNATPSKKVNWITSLGMSSHFFLNQEYTYKLLLNNTTQITTNSNDDPDDNNRPHILNNLVLSTGIGLNLNKSLYLEIDPTFKLPLEELNEGHKNLGSVGIYFNLRYNFKRKK